MSVPVCQFKYCTYKKINIPANKYKACTLKMRKETQVFEKRFFSKPIFQIISFTI
jgi:CO dehydrogenase/acetyl-CoA synthase alpha subunit